MLEKHEAIKVRNFIKHLILATKRLDERKVSRGELENHLDNLKLEIGDSLKDNGIQELRDKLNNVIETESRLNGAGGF